MEKLISVIIPHYNSNGLLKRTLDSIPLKPEVEIIVVDDLSSENSIKEISSNIKYNHVIFKFAKKKITAGGARNIGLSVAKGKYVIFSDSDDYFFETAFHIFFESIKSKKELYQFRVTSFIEGNGRTGTRHVYMLPFYNREDRIGLLGLVGPCAKLIKLDFLKRNNIRFSEVPAGNDVVFSTMVACKVNNFEFMNQIVYNISQNGGGLTSNINLENSLSRVQQAIKRTQVIRQSKIVSNFSYFSKANQILEFTKVLLKLKHKEYLKWYIRYHASLPRFTLFGWILSTITEKAFQR